MLLVFVAGCFLRLLMGESLGRMNVNLVQIQVVHILKLNNKLGSWLWLYSKINITLSFLE